LAVALVGRLSRSQHLHGVCLCAHRTAWPSSTLTESAHVVKNSCRPARPIFPHLPAKTLCSPRERTPPLHQSASCRRTHRTRSHKMHTRATLTHAILRTPELSQVGYSRACFGSFIRWCRVDPPLRQFKINYRSTKFRLVSDYHKRVAFCCARTEGIFLFFLFARRFIKI
jgi:hypothetical protein